MPPFPDDHEAEFLDSDPPHWVARGLAWLLIGIMTAAAIAVVVVHVPDTVRGRFVLAPRAGADPVRARKDGIVTEVRNREGDSVVVGAALVLLRSPSLIDRSGDRHTLETQRRSDGERLSIAASQHQTRLRAAAAEERRLNDRIEALNRVIASKRRRLALTRELADSAQSGYRRGSVPRLEAVRLDLEASTLGEEIQVATDELEEVRADLGRLARDVEAQELEYRQIRRAIEEGMETARIRIEALGRDLEDLTDSGMVLSAPCRGTVLRINVSGPGAVVREGEVVGEVACAGQRLQAELKVPQAGVPLLMAGQGVKLRYDAFPYQRFGVRFGRVRWVGPAGFASGLDSATFRALIDLEEDSIRVRGRARALEPGMEGSADVVVGRRSLLSYAFEPIRALRENLRELPPAP